MRSSSSSRSRGTARASTRTRARRPRAAGEPPIVMAVTKGRVLPAIADKLGVLGVDPGLLLSDDRTLVRDDPKRGIRFLLLKPDDVPTYVEYGAADLGIVGRDILMEREYDLYAPLDLGIGACRLSVAAKIGVKPTGRRVATKFTNIARRYFLGKGQQMDFVYVQSSVELAPLTGLADFIVDLVQSGETLHQNGLEEREVICDVTTVVVANRVALKMKRERLSQVLAALDG